MMLDTPPYISMSSTRKVPFANALWRAVISSNYRVMVIYFHHDVCRLCRYVLMSVWRDHFSTLLVSIRNAKNCQCSLDIPLLWRLADAIICRYVDAKYINHKLVTCWISIFLMAANCFMKL